MKLLLVLTLTAATIAAVYSQANNETGTTDPSTTAPTTSDYPATTASPLLESICDALNYTQNNPGSSDVQCETNDVCNGLVCQLLVQVGQGMQEDFYFEMNVIPCTTPPGLKIFLSNIDGSAVLVDQVFYESVKKNISGEYSFVLDVVVEHSVDTLTVQVRLEDPSDSVSDIAKRQLPTEPLQIIERTEFPISDVICPTSTCAAMDEIIELNEERNFTCNLTQNCDGITCFIPVESFFIPATIRILPCANPVAAHVVIDFDLANIELLNALVSNRDTLPVLFGEDEVATLDVTVDQLDNALGLQISAITPNGTITVLDYTYVPYSRDEMECEFFNPTCLSLQTISEKAYRSNRSCPTIRNCTGLQCFLDLFETGALFPVNILPQPCDSSVTLEIREAGPLANDTSGEGGIIITREVRKNKNFPLFNKQVSVVVDRFDDAVGFELSVNGEDSPIIPYSFIPLNKTGVTCGAPRMEPHMLSAVVLAVAALLASLHFI